MCSLCLCTNIFAHGGVFLEEDVCVIQIDFFQAHFTIYQPQITQHKEFCEDIPEIGDTLFVLEYLHDGLREMPIDFRIIKDTQKLGRFAKLEDIEKIENINSHTVFYQAPQTGPYGIYLAKYDFLEEGYYIGIVSAERLSDGKAYTAVFPFQVGGNNWGYIPLIIIVAIFLQLNYWLLNGGFARLRKTFSS